MLTRPGQENKRYKRYVKVNAEFDEEGNVRPLTITHGSKSYTIDKVLDICPRASLKAGGAGMRYTCRIRGRETYLFLEDGGRWFVEEKVTTE